jgi:predicted ATP-grasp superfamily ATP-dependent carboligase
MKQVRKPSVRKGGDRCPRRRVLALVGDTQVGLWVVRSLGRNGLTVYSVCKSPDGMPAHSRYSSGVWTPEHGAYDPGFLDELEDLARRLNVGSIMPISEAYHRVLIDNRERFEPGIHIFSPPADCFDKAVDKSYMHQLCERIGVPVARGTTLERLMAGAEGQLNFPLVLRTRAQNERSIGGAPWKAAYARDPDQLKRLHEDVHGADSNVIVQEYHPGVEVHIQILMHGGEVVALGGYIGEHHMPLAGGVTVQRVSWHHEKMINDGVRLLKEINWEGLAATQFHYDPQTDRYIFLEINPRFCGGLPTVIHGGFEAPFLLWQSHFEPECMQPGRYRLGVRTRILGGDANWALAMMRGDELPPGQRRLTRLATMARFLWNFGPWTIDDSIHLGDIKPTLTDWRQMLRKLRQREVDLVGNP